MLKLLDVLVLLEVGVEIDVLVLRAKKKTALSTLSRGEAYGNDKTLGV